MCVYVYVCVFINPFRGPGCDIGSICQVEFNRFEFRVFILLDWLPNQGERTQSALLFTHNWRENNWIYTFSRLLVLCELQSASSRI